MDTFFLIKAISDNDLSLLLERLRDYEQVVENKDQVKPSIGSVV